MRLEGLSAGKDKIAYRGTVGSSRPKNFRSRARIAAAVSRSAVTSNEQQREVVSLPPSQVLHLVASTHHLLLHCISWSRSRKRTQKDTHSLASERCQLPSTHLQSACQKRRPSFLISCPCAETLPYFFSSAAAASISSSTLPIVSAELVELIFSSSC